MRPRSRWSRIVLALFPRSFRRDFGEELVRDLEKRRGEERFRGRLGSVRWGLYVVGDLLRALPRVHGREWRRRPGAESPGGPGGAGVPHRGARRPWAGLFQDVRSALRGFRRHPSFFVAATVTLGVGVGASTAIFGVADGVILRPLPYPDPGELVELGTLYEGYDQLASTSPPDFRDWQERARSFDRLAASRLEARTLLDRGEPRRVETAAVSAGFFELLGARPQWGRSFTDRDDRVGAPAVAVVSHDFWRSLGSPSPGEGVGTLRLDDAEFTVVGILPADFHPPEAIHQDGVRVWYPLAQARDPLDQRGAGFLQVLGRLAEGIDVETARTEMAAIGRALSREYPDVAERGVGVEPLHPRTVGESRQILGVLLGAVGALLLIACVNVVNLSLVRATHRSGELAVRSALGAGRFRILRQLGVEAALVTVVSTGVAVLLAHLGVEAFRALSPDALPRMAEIQVTPRVLAFALAVASGTAFLATLVPGWLHEGGSVHPGSRSRTSTTGRRTGTVRSGLVVAETALALVLLTGAGLLVHSLVLLVQVDPGFDPGDAAYMEVRLRGDRYADDERRIAFFRDLQERIAALPGVTSAGATNNLPLGGSRNVLEGIPGDGAGWEAGPVGLSWHQVTPGYFEAAGIPVLRGRAFGEGDTQGSPAVAVVNRSLADRLFPTRDPLGGILRLGTDPASPTVTVVGVVGNVRQHELGAPPAPELYLSFLQSPRPGMYVLARTDGDPEGLLPAMRRSLREADPDLPIAGLGTLSDHVAASLGRPRFHATLLVTFAGVALLLAFLGIYGTTRFTVERRTREMGIRMALGADARNVLGLVLGKAMTLIVAGLALGAVGSVLAARMLEGFVFGIEPVDPATLLLVALVLGSAGLVAAWLPARRATSLDPARTLREA